MRGTELQRKRCAWRLFFCISINNLYLFYEARPSSAVPKGMPCGKDGTW